MTRIHDVTHLAIRERMDKRKCTVGYKCGSTCINMRKECKSGGSAISQERLKRLKQVSSGGSQIRQRGIAPVKAQEAEKLVGSITARRGEKASELWAARKKASEPAETTPTEAPRPSNKKESPRNQADTVKGSGDYLFARDSAIKNAGEDLVESARHKRNMFRTIDEAEASGQVEKILTRDNLIKNFPTDLISGATEKNILSRLVAHFSLKSFPPNLPSKEIDTYTRSLGMADKSVNKKDAKTLRKEYFDSFQTIKKFIEVNKDMPPDTFRRALGAEVLTMIGRLRGATGSGFSTQYTDRFNPTANALVAMHKRLIQQKRSTSTVYGQMEEFAKFLKSDTGFDGASTLTRAAEVGKKILEGSSIGSAFGKEGGGKKRFSAADLYVNNVTVNRKGGRHVTDTAQAATDSIIKRNGFRGLQYGNSVTDSERRHHVKKAAEAMLDLADMTGLPDRAIGLNGSLGLAIGARGRGGAMAHFEPGLKVINLTRKNGVGTFAHEWGHALDNYISKNGGSFLSKEGIYGKQEDKTRSSMREVKESFLSSGYGAQVYRAIVAERKSGKLISSDYWTSSEEMFARAFETHIQLKLRKAGRVNSYLTQATNHDLWPSRAQAEAMEPMFDKLLASIRDEKFPGPINRDDCFRERLDSMIRSFSEIEALRAGWGVYQ